MEKRPTLEEVKEYFKNVEKVKCTNDSDIYYLDFSEDLEFYSDSIRLLNQKDEPYSGSNTYCQIWSKRKGYAKIISYKEETYKITKEQILKYNMKDEFPSVFKEDEKELVDFNRWVVTPENPKWISKYDTYTKKALWY